MITRALRRASDHACAAKISSGRSTGTSPQGVATSRKYHQFKARVLRHPIPIRHHSRRQDFSPIRHAFAAGVVVYVTVQS